MKMKDLKLKTEAELLKMLDRERAVLRDLRFQVSSEQHKKVRDIRAKRKLIAQIMTLVNNKDLLLNKGDDKSKEVKK